MKRPLLLSLGVLIVVAAAAIGWVAGSQIKSSDQVAAEAEPPEPSLITVPVESLVISADIITRGDVRFDQPESVSSQGVALPGVSPVITWAPEPGLEFEEGAILYEVAGRPVFALQGDLPLFRDLTRGAEGQDVAQFQQALARLGFDPGTIDGIFGPETETAADDLYRAAGYEILGPADDELALVQSAKDSLADVKRAYDQAKQASDDAAAAEAKVAPAQADLNAATLSLATAEAALEAALDSGLAEDDPRVLALQAEAAAAQTALDSAAGALAQIQAEAESARGQADAFDLSEARETLTRAQRDLADINAQVGSKVPVAEVVFFELFPLRVDTVNVKRGDVAGGEVMRVSGSRLAVDSSVATADAEPIEVGDRVVIDLRNRGIEVGGTVTVKADRPGTNGVSPQQVYLEIVPDEVMAELNDANVRITIPVETTGGEVLAVPAAAISATADGSSQVRVENDDGSTRSVIVLPGLSSAGLVQITAVDGDLTAGDRVVVGIS